MVYLKCIVIILCSKLNVVAVVQILNENFYSIQVLYTTPKPYKRTHTLM